MAGWNALAARISKESFQPSFNRYTSAIREHLKSSKASQKKTSPFWKYLLLSTIFIIGGIYWYSQEHYLNLLLLPVGAVYFIYKWRKDEEVEESDDPFGDIYEHLGEKANDKLVDLLDSLS